MFQLFDGRFKQWVVSLVAIGTTIIHLYAPIYGIWPSLRVISVATLTVLTILLFPLRLPGGRVGMLVGFAIDVVLLSASIAVGVYAGRDYNELQLHSGMLEPMDMVMGFALVLTVLEASRRTLGLGLPILAIVAMIYALLGPYMPTVIAHKGADFELLIDYVFILPEGVYGLPVGVTATYVIVFILFGSLLDASGAGRYFIEIARTMMGHRVGGPAKMAVVSSAFMGSISGSAVANVVTTGTFTIPLMIKSGVKPRMAAAVEACASTGGLILPPVMGAAAFVMGDMLGIGYTNVAIAAAIPAILYYVALYVAIHFLSKRDSLYGLGDEEVIPGRQLVRESWWMVLPIIVLLIGILQNYSAMRAAGMALLCLTVLVLIMKGPRQGVRCIVEALDQCARATAPIMMACACAGIVIAVILLTGIGLRFTSIVLELAGGSKILALLFTMLVTLVLGMGLPVTASYLTAVTLAAPVLTSLGVPPLAAHMFVLYYAAFSAITPPVALASFAACGIARAPIGWGFKEVGLGLSGYILPFFFCYDTSILIHGSEPLEIAAASLTALVAVFAAGLAVAGYFLAPLNIVQRLMLAAAAMGFVGPFIVLDVIGAMLTAVAVGPQIIRRLARGNGLVSETSLK